MKYLEEVDTASPQTGALVFPLPSAHSHTDDIDAPFFMLSASVESHPADLLHELFFIAECEACGLTLQDFSAMLSTIGARCNFNQPLAVTPDSAQRVLFTSSLRLADLALAHACVLGHEVAWARFLSLYRVPLSRAAITITRSATLGEDLADSLYAELYGIHSNGTQLSANGTKHHGHSPLASYSGRGSLLGWLRTTLAQRFVDHHRRTYRKRSIRNFDATAPHAAHEPLPAHLMYLRHALTRTFRSLNPENRFLLSAYYLDERTLLQIGHILHVHEATVSRRIKRLSHDLRDEVLLNLQIGGLSLPAAEEALGIDPRDLEINLRWLLQSSQVPPFQAQTAPDSKRTSSEQGQS